MINGSNLFKHYQRALYVFGRSKAISVSTREFPDLEEDSIYFEEGSAERVYNLKETKVGTTKFANIEVIAVLLIFFFGKYYLCMIL